MCNSPCWPILLLPGAIWQCLEKFLIVTIGSRGGCYCHFLNRGEKCGLKSKAQNSSPVTTIQLQMSKGDIVKPSSNLVCVKNSDLCCILKMMITLEKILLLFMIHLLLHHNGSFFHFNSS